MAAHTMLCNFRKQKQKPTQPRMIFRRCNIFRLVKPAFFRLNGIFTLERLLLLSSGNVERNPGPESISQTGNFKLSTVKGLRICHLNVPSLVKKIEEIQVFCETQLPHVLSSTKLKDGSDTMASPLSVILNLTIELNVIPAEWKKSEGDPSV